MRSLVLALLLLAAPASGATIVLDFEEEALGVYAPLVSAECGGCVSFAGASGLWVNDFSGSQSQGRGIAPDDDDSGHGLTITFTSAVTALALDFGNDDPEVLDAADEAVLEAFLGATKVGEARVLVNANDVMDQTISLSGTGAFDRALFRYPGEIDEVIDNVTFETLPELGTLGLLMLMLAAVANSQARQREPF